MANLITLQDYKTAEGISAPKDDARLNVLIPSVSELVKTYTGKTPLENLAEISELDLDHKKNIQKQTLESSEFHILVKNRIKKNNEIIKLTN